MPIVVYHSCSFWDFVGGDLYVGEGEGYCDDLTGSCE